MMTLQILNKSLKLQSVVLQISRLHFLEAKPSVL